MTQHSRALSKTPTQEPCWSSSLPCLPFGKVRASLNSGLVETWSGREGTACEWGRDGAAWWKFCQKCHLLTWPLDERRRHGTSKPRPSAPQAWRVILVAPCCWAPRLRRPWGTMPGSAWRSGASRRDCCQRTRASPVLQCSGSPIVLTGQAAYAHVGFTWAKTS